MNLKHNIFHMSQKNFTFIDNFKQSCLIDLRSKERNLQTIKQSCFQNIQTQKQQKVEQLSKILVNLEDEILICLRQKMKFILDVQIQKIGNQVSYFHQEVDYMIAQQQKNLQHMIEIIQKDSISSNKLLGKVAQGKIQSEHKKFVQDVQNLKLSPCPLHFDKQEMCLLIEQIYDILHLKYPKQNLFNTQRQSKIFQIESKRISINPIKNNSNLTEGKSKLRISGLNCLKNQSAISIFIQDEQNVKQDEIAIDEYKETKTLKKMKKIENQLKKRQTSPGKDVQHIARMALQRKKLLKQME